METTTRVRNAHAYHVVHNLTVDVEEARQKAREAMRSRSSLRAARISHHALRSSQSTHSAQWASR